MSRPHRVRPVIPTPLAAAPAVEPLLSEDATAIRARSDLGGSST